MKDQEREQLERVIHHQQQTIRQAKALFATFVLLELIMFLSGAICGAIVMKIVIWEALL